MTRLASSSQLGALVDLYHLIACDSEQFDDPFPDRLLFLSRSDPWQEDAGLELVDIGSLDTRLVRDHPLDDPLQPRWLDLAELFRRELVTLDVQRAFAIVLASRRLDDDGVVQEKRAKLRFFAALV